MVTTTRQRCTSRVATAATVTSPPPRVPRSGPGGNRLATAGGTGERGIRGGLSASPRDLREHLAHLLAHPLRQASEFAVLGLRVMTQPVHVLGTEGPQYRHQRTERERHRNQEPALGV